MKLFRNAHAVRMGAFVVVAIVTIPAVLLATLHPASAQFVCIGNATGGAVPPGTADGAGATATGASNNVACGTNANASVGGADVAVGNNAIATGGNATAVGNGANATLLNSSAFGNTAVATGDGATAIGSGATAAFTNAAAFGTNATATRNNQQTFGTATNTYTMSGITSAASHAAQTGPTQLVTSDAGGNLATTTVAALGLASAGDVAGINSQLAGINSQLGAINGRIDDLTGKAYSGIAMAFAMAAVPTVLANERFAATFNYGNYLGSNGLAFNAAARVNDNVQVNAGFGYGPDQRVLGGRVGMRLGW